MVCERISKSNNFIVRKLYHKSKLEGMPSRFLSCYPSSRNDLYLFRYACVGDDYPHGNLLYMQCSCILPDILMSIQSVSFKKKLRIINRERKQKWSINHIMCIAPNSLLPMEQFSIKQGQYLTIACQCWIRGQWNVKLVNNNKIRA